MASSATTASSQVLICYPYAVVPKSSELPGGGKGYSLYACDVCQQSMWVDAMGQLLWEKWVKRLCFTCGYKAGLVDGQGRTR